MVRNTNKSNGKKRRKRPLTARNADRHVLYQRSVQEPSVELAFIDRVYRKVRGHRPLTLREDFCGTALLCATWVDSLGTRTATGIDIDPSVLRWGVEHNIEPLGDKKDRVTLLRQDVRAPVKGAHDVICAFNFSYWIFRTRDEMRAYFAHVRKGLERDGLFMLDAYGGWEAPKPMLEKSAKGGFTYVWDQHKFDPISHEVENHIHFLFPDGTKLHRAFSYYWRFWTLPELQELLLEAGFSSVDVYWDRSSDPERDDFRPSARAPNQPGWLAYLIAQR
jgi:SAM-dependent methyltransferase